MTNKLIKKNSNISFKNLKENELSIQFNLDGFSFSIYNNSQKKTVYFCEYQFEETQNTPSSLLEKIKEIFKTDIHLQGDFLSVTVIHQNNLSTIVPNLFFDEEKLESYLKYNVKTLTTDFITYDSLANFNAKNVYIPYVNINNYLFQNFGSFEYKHHTTVLIEKIVAINRSNEKTMYVNVTKNSLDIVVLDAKKLLLSNSFFYSSKEDFIYYILFVAEQLKLDTTLFSLYLMGDISLDSDTYNITYKYIKNIYFLESDNAIFNDLKTPKHTNYILLGS
ncbi:DUF3822 family protein [Polaribacter tangerinus]|uniref:DUF3822 family protein n=1 Tax=Polaribacter tangerinus TaxID=1920034 RepID=UPI0018E93E8D|nr:DUF3822 family protein [Polaribacter tangerinus]